MLKIYFGDMQDVIFNTSIYFKNVYHDEWIIDPLSKQMIEDIDKSKVLYKGVIESPVLGMIPPTSLSGGVKTLILIDNRPDKVFNINNCGDNCAKWLLRIGKAKDVTINARHLIDFGEDKFDIYVLNTNQLVHSMEELIGIAINYV